MITPVQKLVPNFQKGRGGMNPDCIVIHIAEGLRDSVYQTFLNTQVSTHYLVNKDGSVWQFVKEEDTAWGNGRVSNPKAKLVLDRPNINPNLYTISIEHEGFSAQGDMNETMYETSIELVREIAQAHAIPLDGIHVIRHRDIFDQKTCPGVINVERIIAGAMNSNPARQLVLEIEERVAKLKTML